MSSRTSSGGGQRDPANGASPQIPTREGFWLAVRGCVLQAHDAVENAPATGTNSDSRADPRRELATLAAALRAHLEQLGASGAWGVPPSPPREARAAAATSNANEARSSSRPVPESLPTAVSAGATTANNDDGATRAAAPIPALSTATAVASPARLTLPLASSTRLTQLADELKTCTRCALHEGRTQTVFARGSGASGLVFVGEGPGEEEDRRGQPFVGAAGQLLDRMIAAMQLARDDVYVCNIVKCRPPRNRKPELEEMHQCMPYLAEQLSLLEPKVIVALGATAAQGLLGTTEGIMRMRGQWKLYRGSVPVMPTFHPAYLLRQPQAKREVWDDLREVLRRLGAPA